MNLNPSTLLEDNNSNTTLKKGGRWSAWSTYEETSFNNDSSNLLNDDEGTIYNEVNVCGIIGILYI